MPQEIHLQAQAQLALPRLALVEKQAVRRTRSPARLDGQEPQGGLEWPESLDPSPGRAVGHRWREGPVRPPRGVPAHLRPPAVAGVRRRPLLAVAAAPSMAEPLGLQEPPETGTNPATRGPAGVAWSVRTGQIPGLHWGFYCSLGSALDVGAESASRCWRIGRQHGAVSASADSPVMASATATTRRRAPAESRREQAASRRGL